MNVLLVEDEALVSLLVEEMLRCMGLGIVGPAANSHEAFEFIRDDGIDFAMLDINLGGVDRAYEIADRLTEKSIPYAFVTGYGSSAVHEQYSSVPVLCKPFSADELRKLIREVAGSI
jgi:CheY-like chemotaxis protein